VAALLAHQPVPPGDRVAILTNVGGPGVLAADACEVNGLVVGPLADGTQVALRRLLCPHASVANPVDMAAEATPDRYRGGLELLLADPLVDAVIAIYIPPVPTAADAVADAIVQASAAAGPKPVLSCFLSARGMPEVLRRGSRPIPSYVFPESAAAALAYAAHYGMWRRQPSGIIPDLSGIDREAARRLIDDAQSGWLPRRQVERLLAGYGVRIASPGTAATADEAVRAVEVLIGVSTDSNFGPIVSFAVGGLSHELLGDVVFRITPITDRDAREMIRAARSFPLLEGWRGAPAGDVQALEELVLRVSAMVEDIPELVEMDLSPVRVLPPGQGVTVLEARVNLKRVPG
jgi:acyl-CoA synthetase (NDP forming)